MELTHAAVFNHLEETFEISVRNGQLGLAAGQGPQEVLNDVRAQKLAVDGRVYRTFMVREHPHWSRVGQRVIHGSPWFQSPTQMSREMPDRPPS